MAKIRKMEQSKLKPIDDVGNKNHMCESCGKSFSREDNLKRHIHTIHEGPKYHKCESCGK